MSVAAADLASFVRAMGVPDTSVSDANLTILCNFVIETYCRARPLYVVDEDGITTVNGQQNYAVPDACIGVDRVLWLVRGGYSATELLGELSAAGRGIVGISPVSAVGATELDFQSPEQVTRWRSLLSTWEKNWAGSFHIQESGTDGAEEIWLDPTPSSDGVTIPVFYWKARTLVPDDQLTFLQAAALALGQIAMYGNVTDASSITMGSYSEVLAVGAGVRMVELRAARLEWARYIEVLGASFIPMIG